MWNGLIRRSKRHKHLILIIWEKWTAYLKILKKNWFFIRKKPSYLLKFVWNYQPLTKIRFILLFKALLISYQSTYMQINYVDSMRTKEYVRKTIFAKKTRTIWKRHKRSKHPFLNLSNTLAKRQRDKRYIKPFLLMVFPGLAIATSLKHSLCNLTISDLNSFCVCSKQSGT